MARAALRGRRSLGLKLRKLKTEVRVEIEGATEANARDMARLAKQFAPEDEGDLKRSIRAESESDGPAIRWRVVAGDEIAFYARMVEFGTAAATKGARVTNASGRARKAARTHGGTPARPYFFPAYRALRRRMRARLSRAFTKAKRKVFR